MPRLPSVGIAAFAKLPLAALALAWAAIGSAATPSASTTVFAGAPEQLHQAAFLMELPSRDAQRVTDWVVSTHDNGTLPFVIIDKVQAKVFVFDATGQLRGATLALMGLARGDDSVPGIGEKKLSAIGPGDRTTPAGRFVASLGRDFHTDVLWVDYRTSLSLHRVIDGTPGDHRLQRLATKSPLDKRISFGCINVPANFFEQVVLKAFAGTQGIVYILPEVKTLGNVFQSAGFQDRRR